MVRGEEIVRRGVTLPDSRARPRSAGSGDRAVALAERSLSLLTDRPRRLDAAGWRLAAANAAGLVVGAGLDLVFGDPRRLHPVAGFGTLVQRWERHSYRPSRLAGLRFAAVAIGVPVAAAVGVDLATRRRPLARAVAVAGGTWLVLGGTSLRREATGLAAALTAGDVAGARARLPRMCGRDPSTLDTSGLARATVESLAENTSDAVVAPLCWGALAGLPGLIGYRAVNTLDAMVGHRSARYRTFGTVAARLDDLANLAPARLAAALTVAVAPVAGGSRRAALRTWLRDGHRHPSPNAGQVEAAAAGALGVRLGGRNVYAGRVEERPQLGTGRRAEPVDIVRAARLSAAVGAATVALTAGHLLSAPGRRALLRRAGLRLAGRLADRRERFR
jgi:adenosylcobinamide-phosphate synthase